MREKRTKVSNIGNNPESTVSAIASPRISLLMGRLVSMGGEASKKSLLKGGPLIALLLLIAYLSFASPHFFTARNLSNVAVQSSINAILAIGQTMVIISGGIDLSVGAVLALSASVAAVAMTYHGQSMVVGMLLALGTGALVGSISGIVIAKTKVPDFVATLGIMTAARGLALIVTGGLPVPSHKALLEVGAGLPSGLIWLGSGDILGVPVPALVIVAVTIMGWHILTNTTLGRAIYAIGGNREAARVSGISIDRTKIMAYTIMGLLAAVAGIVLTGRLNSANALMAGGAELHSIAAVVIGGTTLLGGAGGVVGTLIGAFIMGTLGNGLNLLGVSAFWQQVIMGMLIISVVVFDQWRRRRFAV
ncbi:MAG: Ribose import permease protein RbsC [Chloroflexi bacterium]|nr:Ribose import permease protein RbsC [Chloroflexota bacterium]